MIHRIFLSPQVKRCAIITYTHGICYLPDELPNNLSLMIKSGKSPNHIDPHNDSPDPHNPPSTHRHRPKPTQRKIVKNN